jgi:hypothetical protein
MLCTIGIAALMALGDVPSDALTVSASIDAKRLRRGGDYEIVLKIETAPGWSATDSGVPNPILQIEVPESATLAGEVIDSYKALSRNEFLMEPFERLIKDASTTIPFKVKKHISKSDKTGESFGLNVLTYLKSPENGQSYYLRRRLELPLAPQAVAVAGDAANSKWGVENTLHIGDKADDFSLPRADGTTRSLSEYLGKKNIIVTTYRAHW